MNKFLFYTNIETFFIGCDSGSLRYDKRIRTECG